mmetsp:Transcript_16722/g.30382  ORF Transcript_16722/g.30382 Transcript_16722/m.30382 type:complete len:231 (+) Transcript_16722:1846-2538(+)
MSRRLPPWSSRLELMLSTGNVSAVSVVYSVSRRALPGGSDEPVSRESAVSSRALLGVCIESTVLRRARLGVRDRGSESGCRSSDSDCCCCCDMSNRFFRESGTIGGGDSEGHLRCCGCWGVRGVLLLPIVCGGGETRSRCCCCGSGDDWCNIGSGDGCGGDNELVNGWDWAAAGEAPDHTSNTTQCSSFPSGGRGEAMGGGGGFILSSMHPSRVEVDVLELERWAPVVIA